MQHRYRILLGVRSFYQNAAVLSTLRRGLPSLKANNLTEFANSSFLPINPPEKNVFDGQQAAQRASSFCVLLLQRPPPARITHILNNNRQLYSSPSSPRQSPSDSSGASLNSNWSLSSSRTTVCFTFLIFPETKKLTAKPKIPLSREHTPR